MERWRPGVSEWGEVLRPSCEGLPKNPYTADSGRGIGRCYITGGFVIVVSHKMRAFASCGHGTSLGNANFFQSGRDLLPGLGISFWNR